MNRAATYVTRRVFWPAVCAARGRRYSRKIDLACAAARAVLPYLDPRLDRFGVAGFDSSYVTRQAPDHDFRRGCRALSRIQGAVAGRPAGSRLFDAVGSHLCALQMHSRDRPQVTFALTDGGDDSAASPVETGRFVRDYAEGRPADRHFVMAGVGKNAALDYARLGAFNVASGGRAVLLDNPHRLAVLVRDTLHRTAVLVAGGAVTAGPVTAAVLLAALRVERRGIDLCFLIDSSPSMADHVVG